ncbi:hypothetical protein [Cereibacter sphaeroides]|uniref:hypothetical protein n=1 Tax=Cereibacter sphaeroides TaxID=1063 RepID=UPI000191CBCE|nr:hypothetical protein [Cereibacter sphaeroides]ACM03141.1 Hypothetical Protein RSKD131_3281 [Cereibacter sphaeroides KD131]
MRPGPANFGTTQGRLSACLVSLVLTVLLVLLPPQSERPLPGVAASQSDTLRALQSLEPALAPAGRSDRPVLPGGAQPAHGAPDAALLPPPPGRRAAATLPHAGPAPQPFARAFQARAPPNRPFAI